MHFLVKILSTLQHIVEVPSYKLEILTDLQF